MCPFWKHWETLTVFLWIRFVSIFICSCIFTALRFCSRPTVGSFLDPFFLSSRNENFLPGLITKWRKKNKNAWNVNKVELELDLLFSSRFLAQIWRRPRGKILFPLFLSFFSQRCWQSYFHSECSQSATQHSTVLTNGEQAVETWLRKKGNSLKGKGRGTVRRDCALAPGDRFFSLNSDFL